MQAAIHVEGVAGGEGQVAGGQQGNGAAHILGLPPTADRGEAGGDARLVGGGDGAVMSVRITPGRISCTAIPFSARRTAKTRATIEMAALEAAYSPRSGEASVALAEEMKTMLRAARCGAPAASIRRATPWARKNPPRAFTLKARSQDSGVTSSRSPRRIAPTPALFTRHSSPPNAPHDASRSASWASSAAMSATWKAKRPPAASTATAVSAAPSSETSAPITSKPRAARAAQVARPMPRRAPVTRAAGRALMPGASGP